jgi:hypothetical protein
MAMTAWLAKGCHHLNLPVGEWLDRGTQQADHADRHAFAHQRHAEHGAIFAALLIIEIVVFRIRETVWNVNGRGPTSELRPGGMGFCAACWMNSAEALLAAAGL